MHSDEIRERFTMTRTFEGPFLSRGANDILNELLRPTSPKYVVAAIRTGLTWNWSGWTPG